MVLYFDSGLLKVVLWNWVATLNQDVCIWKKPFGKTGLVLFLCMSFTILRASKHARALKWNIHIRNAMPRKVHGGYGHYNQPLQNAHVNKLYFWGWRLWTTIYLSCIWNSITHFEVEQILPAATRPCPLVWVGKFPLIQLVLLKSCILPDLWRHQERILHFNVQPDLTTGLNVGIHFPVFVNPIRRTPRGAVSE